MFLRTVLRWSARVGRSGGPARRDAPPLSPSDGSAMLQPQRQRGPRHRARTTYAPSPTATLRRASLSDQLQAPHAVPSAESAQMVAAPSTAGASSSPFLMPSHYEPMLAAHHARTSAASETWVTADMHPVSPATPSSSVSELAQQQTVLRDAFHHAYKRHNVALRKDKRVYAQEVAAFRQAHGGRSPRAHEVSPHTHATLVPVAALQALRHVNPARASVHQTVTQAVVLQEAVTKNSLVQSRDKTLVRCLSCFHVYSARPRTLWADEVGQSWLEVEQEKDLARRANALAKNPKLRKRLYSVAQQSAQRQSDPTKCPQCGSPRAQWMMEYVHHSTHMNGANPSQHD